jgi:c-di-GMP-binding flagellar brake protein YcgR
MHWRRCLEQIWQRHGAIEIAVLREYQGEEEGRHLMWRVRLLQIRDREIIIEHPGALGERMPLAAGIQMVGIMSIGQNRWIFTTIILGSTQHEDGSKRAVPALRLQMPESVDRCQRRSHDRVQTTALSLPQVELWPLLDPKSVALAERANELQLEQEARAEGLRFPTAARSLELDDVMPEVGPKFSGVLLNLGGGGMGVRVRSADSQALARHKVFWLQAFLPPELRTPICATAKLVHSHMDSAQNIYAGMAFDFTFNPGHHRFVVDQIRRYVTAQQAGQVHRRAS